MRYSASEKYEIIRLVERFTLTPLLLFNIAARRLNLSTVGFIQYLAPTLMLVLAVKVFGEPFSTDKAMTFALVWLGLAFYTVDALLQRRRLTHRRSKDLERME
jgi:chloramphenicol-sensitive protein RarD